MGKILVQNSTTMAFVLLTNIAHSIDVKLILKSGENGQSLVQNSKTITFDTLPDIAHSNDIFN